MMHERDPVVAAAAEARTTHPTEQNGLQESAPGPARDKLTRAVQIAFISFVVVTFAYVAHAVLLPLFLAWVISMMLKPLVRWMRACRIPTPLGAGLIVVLGVVLVGLGAVRFGTPALEWVKTTPENVPRLREKFQHILRPAARLSEAASNVGKIEPSEGGAKKTSPAVPVEVKSSGVSTTIYSWTGSVLAGIGETIALVFLLLASGDVLIERVVHVLPTLRDKKQVLTISHELQSQISRYLFSVTLINICLGVAVGLALHFLGMPNAVMWGGVAALLNYIPYFGPVLGMLAVGLGGMFVFDTFTQALLPAGAYLILHLIEADAITPFVLGRRFTLNPVIIFVALMFFVWLWGILGALLAMPLLVTLKVICERVPALATVGELLAGKGGARTVSP